MALGRVGSADFHRAPDCRGSRTHLTHFLKVKGCLFLLFCWCVYFTALPPYPQSSSSLTFVAAATHGNNGAPFPPPANEPEEYDFEEVDETGKLPPLVESPVRDTRALRESISSPTPIARGPFADLRTRQYTGPEVAVNQFPTPMSKTSPAADPAGRYEAQEEEEAFSRMMPDELIDAEESVQASSPWGGEEGGEKRAYTGERLTAVEEGSDNWLQPQNEDQEEAGSGTSRRIPTAVAQEATQQGGTGMEGMSHTGTQRASHWVQPSSRTITAWEEGGRTGELSARRRSSRSQSVSGQGPQVTLSTRRSRKRLAKRIAPLAGLAALLLGGAAYAGHKAWKKRRAASTTTSQPAEMPVGVVASPAAVPPAQHRPLWSGSEERPATSHQAPGPSGGSAPQDPRGVLTETPQKFWLPKPVQPKADVPKSLT